MYRRIRMEGMEGKSETDIVDDVLKSTTFAALDDNIADVTSFVDHGFIEGRVLARLPRDDEVARFKMLAFLENLQRPRLFADHNEAAGESPKTIRWYGEMLRPFARWTRLLQSATVSTHG